MGNKVEGLLSRFHGSHENDMSVLEDLLKKYYCLWRRYPYNLISDPHEFYSLISDVLLSVWKKRQTFTSETHILGTIMQLIKWRTINLVRNQRRKEDRLSAIDLQEFEVPEDSFTLDRAMGLIQEIYQALDEIPGQCGIVMKMLFKERKTASEVAEALSITEGAVRAYRARGIEKLKDKFRHLLDDEDNIDMIKAAIMLSSLVYFIFF